MTITKVDPISHVITTRRQALVLAGSAVLSIMAGSSGIRAAANGSARSRLATRMFNFRETVSTVTADAMLAKLKELGTLAGIAGFMVGKNLSPTPFSTRFEWIYLIQFDEDRTTAADPAYRRFEDLRNELTSLCRNEVECDLYGKFPDRIADAPVHLAIRDDFTAHTSRVAFLDAKV